MMTIGKSTGFTLLEMMIALAMAAVLVSPLYIITRSMGEQTGIQRMEIEASQRARTGMDMIVRDFARAGLNTSPNTLKDGRFIGVSGSTAEIRAAVMHLNRNTSGPDAVLLNGNFLGSQVYEADATSDNTIQIPFETGANPLECTQQFNAAYSFAHIVDAEGKEIEAGIESVSLSSGDLCLITLTSTDTSELHFRAGEGVRVAANQTVLYWVEGTKLVRYFVAVNSMNRLTLSSTCTAVGAGNVAALSNQIPGVIIQTTRKVVASDVHDFQVWFRPATLANDHAHTHHHGIDSLDDQMASGEKYHYGYVPPDGMHYVPNDVSANANDNSISCNMLNSDSTTPANIGPERVRSAIVRLSIRTEEPDHNVRAEVVGSDPGRLMRFNLAKEGGSEPVFAHRLRTLVTEIEMPNLAARSDMLLQ